MLDDKQNAGAQHLSNFDVVFNPFTFDKDNFDQQNIGPHDTNDLQGTFFDYCFQEQASPHHDTKKNAEGGNSSKFVDDDKNVENDASDVFFSGSFDDLFENDEKENTIEAFVSINTKNSNEWTELCKEKSSVDIFSPPTVSTCPDSSNDSLSLHDNEKVEQDNVVTDDNNLFNDSFAKFEKFGNLMDKNSFEFFGSECDTSNVFPNSNSSKDKSKKESKVEMNQFKQINKSGNDGLGDESFLNSFIQFDVPNNICHDQISSIGEQRFEHLNSQETLYASPILPMKLLPMMDGSIASKTAGANSSNGTLDVMKGNLEPLLQGGDQKQRIDNGPPSCDDSPKKEISTSLPSISITTKTQQKSSLLTKSPSPFYRNAFTIVRPENKIEKEAKQVKKNDSPKRESNEKKILPEPPKEFSPTKTQHDNINKSWKHNSIAQTTSTQETELEDTLSDTMVTNSTHNTVPFESQCNLEEVFEIKKKKKELSKQNSNEKTSIIESHECEETLSITVDPETTFDSIQFSTDDKCSDTNKSNYYSPKMKISDGGNSEDILGEGSRHHCIYEISPISLIPYFDEEIDVSSHMSKVKSNVRPSIIFSLEELMKWKSGIYLCFGSFNFGDTYTERIRNALETRFDYNVLSNQDYDGIGGASPLPCKIENKRDTLKAPIEILLEIEDWIKKLQTSAVQCVKNKRFNDALVLYQRILAIFREYPEHPVTGTIHHNIGLIHMHIGGYENGRESLLRATNIRKVANGVISTDILNSICMMGMTEYASGNSEEAKSILSEGIRFVLSELGEDELKLSEMLNNLACIFISEHRFSSALKLLQKSFELQTQSIRNLSYSTDEDCKNIERRYRLINLSTTVANIGVTKLYTKDFTSAIIAFEDTLLNQLLVLKPYDPLILSTMDSLAHANTELKVTKKALVIYSKLMQIIRAKQGPNNIKCAQIWREVSIIHRQKGNLKRAIKCIYQLLKCFSRSQSENSDICAKFVSLVKKETRELEKMELALEAKEARSKTMASF